MTGNDSSNESGTRLSRRTFLGTAVTAGLVGTSGCLTLSPKASISGTGTSKVFKKVSVSEPWASGRVSASVSLTPTATTKYGVRELIVISSSGSEFDTGTVQSGQTSKKVFVPVGKSTLSAVDYDGKTVDTVTVKVTGNKVL